VQIIKIEKTDNPKRPEKISLSLKALASDPWNEVRDRYRDGTRLRGTVVRIQQFGAFVELEPAVEGLVHISEMVTGRRINHPTEVVSQGQEVEVVVLGGRLDALRREPLDRRLGEVDKTHVVAVVGLEVARLEGKPLGPEAVVPGNQLLRDGGILHTLADPTRHVVGDLTVGALVEVDLREVGGENREDQSRGS